MSCSFSCLMDCWRVSIWLNKGLLSVLRKTVRFSLCWASRFSRSFACRRSRICSTCCLSAAGFSGMLDSIFGITQKDFINLVMQGQEWSYAPECSPRVSTSRGPLPAEPLLLSALPPTPSALQLKSSRVLGGH